MGSMRAPVDDAAWGVAGTVVGTSATVGAATSPEPGSGETSHRSALL